MFQVLTPMHNQKTLSVSAEAENRHKTLQYHTESDGQNHQAVHQEESGGQTKTRSILWVPKKFFGGYGSQ